MISRNVNGLLRFDGLVNSVHCFHIANAIFGWDAVCLPGVEAIAQMVELVQELKDGFKFMGFNAVAGVDLKGRGLVFVVPGALCSQHAIGAGDFEIL